MQIDDCAGTLKYERNTRSEDERRPQESAVPTPARSANRSWWEQGAGGFGTCGFVPHYACAHPAHVLPRPRGVSHPRPASAATDSAVVHEQGAPPQRNFGPLGTGSSCSK